MAIITSVLIAGVDYRLRARKLQLIDEEEAATELEQPHISQTDWNQANELGSNGAFKTTRKLEKKNKLQTRKLHVGNSGVI